MATVIYIFSFLSSYHLYQLVLLRHSTRNIAPHFDDMILPNRMARVDA